MKHKPLLALTMGDPAGIGPEIVVKVAAEEKIKKNADIIIYGCPDIIKKAAEKFTNGKIPNIIKTCSLKFGDFTIGKASPECGTAARNTVIKATEDVLEGKVDAIVTAPMNKEAVNMAGIHFTGHTELIAKITGTENFAMMQSAGNLRIVFATTHIPLKDVAAALSIERIKHVARLLYHAILDEGVNSPLLAAAALNPHAGESGYMGSEDEKKVKPALNELRQEGIKIDGPFPPDTLFIESTRKKYDGIISMYHDQGHIPFKMLAFDKGVNSTLGLPIIRTSVDHGTAFEIAWRGKADTGSLSAALSLAAKRVVSRLK